MILDVTWLWRIFITTFPNDEDGQVLSGLADAGVDLTQPMRIEFAVLAPDEASAQAIRNELARNEHEAEIKYDQGEPNEDGIIDPDDDEFGPIWTVYSFVDMIPDYDEIIRIQADLDRLAKPLGGKSDGWGVLVE